MRSRIMLRPGATLLALAALALGCAERSSEPDGVIAQAIDPDAALVIRQIYAAGAEPGAPFSHDFIEIFNRRSAPVSLVGLSLQYASARGGGHFGATAALITELPDVVLAPGRSFLVQEAGGSAGAPLAAPDWIDDTPIAMSATAGKVALVRHATALGCNGGSVPCSPEATASIVDLVGYGNADHAETAPAAAPANTAGILRALDGCADTDDNAADFRVTAAAPRDSASGGTRCNGASGERVSSFAAATHPSRQRR